MSKQIKVTIPESLAGVRLDKALSELLPDYSRAYLQELIQSGAVALSEGKVKESAKVKPGIEVTLQIPDPRKLDLAPLKMDLDILYEDKDLLVINKPAGLVVHPAAGNMEGTLVHGLLAHCHDLSDINGVLRPGIVHRLDKDTSGCLVVAKNNAAHQNLTAQFKNRQIQKIYQCLVYGKWTKGKQKLEGAIGRHPIARKKMAVRKTGGREALSIVTPLEIFDQASFLQVELHTGRTHQIRVHLAHEGYPVLGDREYSKGRHLHKFPLPIHRQLLHAATLGFTHPTTQKPLTFQAPLPQDIRQILNSLRSPKKVL